MNDPTRKTCICDWGDFCKKAFDVLNENLEEGLLCFCSQLKVSLHIISMYCLCYKVER